MPDLGMFRHTGALLRAPGGNVENIADQKPVIRWAALNVGGEVERDPSRWKLQRSLYANAHIETLPWLHCHALEDVDFLVSVGKEWDSPAIGLNIEDVVSDNLELSRVAQRVESWTGEILMPTLPWVQNGQGWEQLARCVAALEIFPDENDDSKKPQDDIDHAFEEGLTKVTLMYKTKAPNLPEHYDLSLCHSLYTGDDITPTQEAWAAWAHEGEEHPPMPSKPHHSPQSSDDPNWHKKAYPKNANPPVIAFVRPLYPPNAVDSERRPSPPGPDVKAIKRAISHAQRVLPWSPEMWDDVYDDVTAHGDGSGLDRSGIAGFQKQMDIPATGWVGKATFEALRTSVIPAKPGVSHAGEPLFDSVCLDLLRQAAKLFEPGPELAFPFPPGTGGSVSLSGLHVTAGLDGNWALDFMAAGGTPIVAYEESTVRKLSGRDPADGADQTIGIFGWSIHLETADGYRYFATHLGERESLSVGDNVKVGQLLGKVGHWPGNPGRSHLHLGVTSPKGETDAKSRIQAVGSARRFAAP